MGRLLFQKKKKKKNFIISEANLSWVLFYFQIFNENGEGKRQHSELAKGRGKIKSEIYCC